MLKYGETKINHFFMASLHMMTLPYFYGSSKNCCFVATKYLSYSKSLALLAYTKGKKHCGCVSVDISNEALFTVDSKFFHSLFVTLNLWTHEILNIDKKNN